jgi:uncharacterized protein (DUF2147 family)
MARLRVYLVVMAFSLTATDCLADEIIGTWMSEQGAMQVRFEPCGEATCGDVVWVKPGSDTRAKPGQRLFFDMRPDGKGAWTGKVDYDGSVYLSRISIEGTDLRTSGCVMSGLFCKSETWRRVSTGKRTS